MANPSGRGGFQKGQSGNPGGRPRSLASVMHAARRHTLPALKTLVTLMKEAKSEIRQIGCRGSHLKPRLGTPDPGFSSRRPFPHQET